MLDNCGAGAYSYAKVAGKAKLLEHLHSDYTEPIRDPIWRHIYLSRQLAAIVSSAAFQKLARIKQLGPTFQVYPGATHTRFAHSLGVFHLAKRLIIAILEQPSAPDLSGEGVRAFLCAALLHDVGHFPFAHSLKELPLKEHEALTADLVAEEPLGGLIREATAAPPELVGAIVDKKRSFAGRESEVQYFRHLLSGVLDPDKLDYLNRDAYFCGVPYGVQDADFVFDKIRPHPTRGISIDEQGIGAVENILFSKYLMYRSVYWHKTVRIATAMIKKAMYIALRDRVIEPGAMYRIDDEEFARFADLSFPAAALIRRVLDRRLYKCIAEEPFDAELPGHRALLDLGERERRESELGRELSHMCGVSAGSESVIIDIPEPISFETDLEVSGGSGLRAFSMSGSVFDGSVVDRFSRALRKLRIIVPPELAPKISKSAKILEWIRR